MRFAASPVYLVALVLAGCGGGSVGGGAPVPQGQSSPAAPATSATFELGTLPAVAKSAAVVFSAGSRIELPLPAGCPASPSCAITVTAPAKSLSAYRLYVYPTSDGSGTALEIATGDITLSQRTNTTAVTFLGVMNSYALTLSPATITEQIMQTVNFGVIAKDVTGATLAYPYFAKNGEQPLFLVTTTESDGTTGRDAGGSTGQPTAPSSTGALLNFAYLGVAPYPVKFTSNVFPLTNEYGSPIPGYAPVVATPAIRQPSNPIGYALAPAEADLYSAGTVTLARSYGFSQNGGTSAVVRFDPAGTVWVQFDPFAYGGPYANMLDGVTAQGTATPRVTLPLGDSLLSFDANGHLYLADPGTISGKPAVLVYAVNAASKLGLLRTLALPAAPCSGAADAIGRIYVATCGPTNGVAEYAPATNAFVPTASNVSAAGPVAVDPAGNVYAMYGTGIGEWTAGTFGPAAPVRTLAGTPCVPADLAVDTAGNIYAITGPSCSAGNKLYYYAAGTTSPSLLQQFSNAPYPANEHSVATPLK